MNRYRSVDAIYRVAKNMPEYNGNPLIEALTPILNKEAAYNLILNLPPFSGSERDLPDEVRAHMVWRLADWIEPLGIHLKFARIISGFIRDGYKARNPLMPATRQMIHYLSMQGKDGIPWPANYQPIASARGLVGLSGMGKTTLMKSVLSIYPQIISHTQYREELFTEKQIVWLKVDCPFDGSLKGLCCAFFSEVDRLLGTDYFNQFARLSIDILLQKFELVAANFHLGLLVIDELQNLVSAKAGGDENMMRFFNHLINSMGLPIFLVGTHKAVNLFSKELKSAKRVNPVYPLERPTETGRKWQVLVKRLWKYQWVRNPAPYKDSIAKTLFDLTQGVTDIVVKLFMLAQWAAIGTSETVDDDLLMSISENEMSMLQPALDALRSGDKERMEAFDDLLEPIDRLKALMETKAEASEEERMEDLIQELSGRHEPEPIMSTTSRKLLSALKEEGLSDDQIEKIVQSVCHVSSDKAEVKKTKNGKSKTEPKDPKDLRKCSESEDAYQELVAAGHIAKDDWEE